MKSGQLNGLDFDRQKIIGNYIVDFYCAEKGVVIEADGNSHDSRVKADETRDEFLKGLGLKVIRISAGDILNNMKGVVAFLSNHPALTGTPPQEGNIPALTGRHPSTGGE